MVSESQPYDEMPEPVELDAKYAKVLKAATELRILVEAASAGGDRQAADVARRTLGDCLETA